MAKHVWLRSFMLHGNVYSDCGTPVFLVGVAVSCWAHKAGTDKLQAEGLCSQCTAAGWGTGPVECQLAPEIAHTNSGS